MSERAQRDRTSSLRTVLSVQLRWDRRSRNTQAFIDSGAIECFIDAQWAKAQGIPIYPLAQPCYVAALDGRPLGSGVVRKPQLL